jgi:hypothetical protein
MGEAINWILAIIFKRKSSMSNLTKNSSAEVAEHVQVVFSKYQKSPLLMIYKRKDTREIVVSKGLKCPKTIQ